MLRRRPTSPLFPYTTLFRSEHRLHATHVASRLGATDEAQHLVVARGEDDDVVVGLEPAHLAEARLRSEEHTSELQSHSDLVCRLLLEKKKRQAIPTTLFARS